MAKMAKMAMLVAGAHFVALASSRAAFAQTAPAPAPSAPGLPAPSEAAPAPVFVHLEGSPVAELQQDKYGDHRHWETVCSAPCDRTLPSAFSYRIAGDGIRNSRVFSLHAESGDRENLTIDESSSSAFVVGIVVASLGGAAIFVGSFVVVIGSIQTGLESVSGSPENHGTETLGLGIMALGLAAIMGGVVAIVSSARTGVAPGPVSHHAAWLTPMGGTGDTPRAARRDAPWAAAFPPVTGVPLFSGHF
jgi:hypothetical protein